MPYPPLEMAAPDEAEMMLKHLLEATQAGQFEAFLSVGNERFRKGISQAMFESVSGQLAMRLRAGYTAEYLAEISQGGMRIFLWKLSFRDKKDEFVARLALEKSGKVAGFIIN